MYKALFIGLLLLFSSTAQARSIYILNSIDCCHYDVSMAGFSEVLGESDVQLLGGYLAKDGGARILADIADFHPDMVAAVGSGAADFLAKNTPNIPLVYFMVMNPNVALLAAKHATGVVLNADPNAVLNVLRNFHVEAKHIGTIVGKQSHVDFALHALQTTMRQQAMQLDVLQVSGLHDLSQRLDDFLSHHDALILMPDREVLTARSFRMIADRCRRARVPLLAPTELFVRLGALASFAVNPYDIGKQAANIALEVLQTGMPEKAVIYVAHKQLVLNHTTMKWNRLRASRHMVKGAHIYD